MRACNCIVINFPGVITAAAREILSTLETRILRTRVILASSIASQDKMNLTFTQHNCRGIEPAFPTLFSLFSPLLAPFVCCDRPCVRAHSSRYFPQRPRTRVRHIRVIYRVAGDRRRQSRQRVRLINFNEGRNQSIASTGTGDVDRSKIDELRASGWPARRDITIPTVSRIPHARIDSTLLLRKGDGPIKEEGARREQRERVSKTKQKRRGKEPIRVVSFLFSFPDLGFRHETANGLTYRDSGGLDET